MKLSDTALIVLGNTASRADRMVPRRPKSPPIADINICRALAKGGLLKTASLPRTGGSDLVTTEKDGQRTGFRITDVGFRAINMDPPGAMPATVATPARTASPTPTGNAGAQKVATVACGPDAAPVAPSAVPCTKATLRDAAQAVLNSWDTEGNLGALEGSMADLRSVLAGTAARSRVAGTARTPRAGTKLETVLAMLRQAEGASGPQIAEATGWAAHTVRGFLAGLKKKGFTVQTLERVRTVGPNKEGARGSYTVYQITG